MLMYSSTIVIESFRETIEFILEPMERIFITLSEVQNPIYRNVFFLIRNGKIIESVNTKSSIEKNIYIQLVVALYEYI